MTHKDDIIYEFCIFLYPILLLLLIGAVSSILCLLLIFLHIRFPVELICSQSFQWRRCIFIKLFLFARHCSKGVTYISLFNDHNMSWTLLLSLLKIRTRILLKIRTRIKRLNNLPKTTWVINNEAKIWTQTVKSIVLTAVLYPLPFTIFLAAIMSSLNIKLILFPKKLDLAIFPAFR